MRGAIVTVATGIRRTEVANRAGPGKQGASLAFVVFCIFIVSNLLHFGSRFPVLGAVRIDLILGITAIVALLLANRGVASRRVSDFSRRPARYLAGLLLFIVVSLPFVEWPGSVLRSGWEPFAKAIFYFVLVVGTVTSARRLVTILLLYTACQAFRVIEPLYLHVTTGYWGSYAAMEGWVTLDRLAGAPSDVVNPNGLAFIIVTTLPLLFSFAKSSIFRAIVVAFLALLFVYTLMLTGSRSGFVVFVVVAGILVFRAKSKILAASVVTAVLVFAVSNLSDLQLDRYRSIVSDSAAGAQSAEGRIAGVRGDLMVAMRNPMFGHGLGTSAEANYHGRGKAQLSHNLVGEVAQEIGFIGLAIFLAFLGSGFRCGYLALRESRQPASVDKSVSSIAAAVLTTMAAGAVFSLASYGLSEFYWYFWIGLCVCLLRESERQASVESNSHGASESQGVRGGRGWLSTSTPHAGRQAVTLR